MPVFCANLFTKKRTREDDYQTREFINFFREKKDVGKNLKKKSQTEVKKSNASTDDSF